MAGSPPQQATDGKTSAAAAAASPLLDGDGAFAAAADDLRPAASPGAWFAQPIAWCELDPVAGGHWQPASSVARGAGWLAFQHTASAYCASQAVRTCNSLVCALLGTTLWEVKRS